MRVWTVHHRPAMAGKPARSVMLRDGFAWAAALFPLLWFLAKALVALQILVGFEARNLHRWSLERQGYRLMGVVQARDEEGAVLNLADRRPDLAHGLA